MTQAFSELIELLSKVEKLSERDQLIMMHAYELGFREGVQTISKAIE